MICRHAADDPSCSSYSGRHRSHTGGGNYSPSSTIETPDAENYQITRVEVVEGNLILEVTYPNCSKCAYEGRKVMVYIGISAAEALKWKKIDPHFRASNKTVGEAPSPDARFPANGVGWGDAIDYASRHSKYGK